MALEPRKRYVSKKLFALMLGRRRTAKLTSDGFKRGRAVFGHAAYVMFCSLGRIEEESMQVRECGVEAVEAGVEVHAMELDLEGTKKPRVLRHAMLWIGRTYFSALRRNVRPGVFEYSTVSESDAVVPTLS
jgi:hypothetical protein